MTRLLSAARFFCGGVLLLALLSGPALSAAKGSGSPAPLPLAGQAVVDSPRRPEPLDINTASAQDLRSLPGMGDAYVRRVIAGRPYTAKNQILTRGVLPQAAYEGIRNLIVAHRPARIP